MAIPSTLPNTLPLMLLSSVYRRYMGRMSSARRFRAPVRLLCYVAKGEGIVQIGDSQYNVKPHTLFHAAPGTKVEFIRRGDHAELYLLWIESPTLIKSRGAWDTLSRGDSPDEPIWPNGEIAISQPLAVLDKIKEAYRLYTHHPYDRFRLQVLFYGLLQEVLPNDSLPRESRSIEQGIGQSLVYIRQHYSEKIKLETLSEISGFTPTSYSREFKRIHGVSPIDYLNGYRVEQAKRMLAERRSGSVKDVSAASGFGNEFYFSRMFKRQVGLSPTQYLRRTNLRVAVVSALRFNDILLTLGTSPVYSTNCHKDKTMDKDAYHAVVAGRIEELRSSAPDLIVCDDYQKPFLDQFESIAPTVILAQSMDWRANYERLAEIVGREDAAMRNFKQLDRKLELSRKQLRSRYGDQSLTIMRVIHKLIRIQGMSAHPLNELIYEELELKPGFCVPVNVMSVEFSPDKYPDIETDHLFVQDLFFHPDDRAIFSEIRKSPKWNAIRAVQNNQLHMTPNWVGMSWSPAGRMQIMDELLQ